MLMFSQTIFIYFKHGFSIMEVISVNIHISKENILLWYTLQNNNLVNTIILVLTKKFMPTFQDIQWDLTQYYSLTKYIANVNYDLRCISKYWSSCHLLFS